MGDGGGDEQRAERYVSLLFVRVCSVLGDVSGGFVVVADDEHDLLPDDHLSFLLFHLYI